MIDPTPLEPVEEARDAFEKRDWVTAHRHFLNARSHAALTADDLYAFADSAWWLGHIDECMDAFRDAYALFLEAGRPRSAAVAALSLGYTFGLQGETALASGWLSRAMRLLRDEADCIEKRLLDYIDIEVAYGVRDYDEVLARALLLQEAGVKFKDRNLIALGVLSEGLARTRQNDSRRGLELLDEAMLAAVHDDLSPEWAGSIYCHMMVICHELGDFERAAAWTRATADWCDSLSAHGPFLGHCRVHRAYVHYLQGNWEMAESDVRLVCMGIVTFDAGCVAEAWYQLGELERVRGNFTASTEAYARARDLGNDAQPGFALHQLAVGRPGEALKSIEAALAAHPPRQPERVRLLCAKVEIALELGELDTASVAADEVGEIAMRFGSNGHMAMSRQARGSVLLAQGDAPEALPALREALKRWRDLDAPYEASRVRVLIARAYRSLGDERAAALELDVATSVFHRLGAGAEIRAVNRLRSSATTHQNITARELEVLILVADGKTNREIGAELFISPRTVSRHLENIYAKLSLSSRAAATAWCIEHAFLRGNRG